jgi:hypothetical protein
MRTKSLACLGVEVGIWRLILASLDAGSDEPIYKPNAV